MYVYDVHALKASSIIRKIYKKLKLLKKMPVAWFVSSIIIIIATTLAIIVKMQAMMLGQRIIIILLT